jgi:hypothetical protein
MEVRAVARATCREAANASAMSCFLGRGDGQLLFEACVLYETTIICCSFCTVAVSIILLLIFQFCPGQIPVNLP